MEKAISLQNLMKETHNMQNLLMILKAHTEGIKERLHHSPLQQKLISKETEAIYANVDRLNKLMSSLLIYRDAKDTMDLLKNGRIDLSKMVVDLVSECRLAFPYCVFQIKVPSKTSIVGDSEKLTFALRMILENAVKYNPHTKPRVSLHLKVEGKKCAISIKDNGVGIAAQDVPKVFLPFYRGRKGMNHHFPNAQCGHGSGVGLATAREIIQFHGGKISLTSKLGKGTEVEIVLPMKNQE